MTGRRPLNLGFNSRGSEYDSKLGPHPGLSHASRAQFRSCTRSVCCVCKVTNRQNVAVIVAWPRPSLTPASSSRTRRRTTTSTAGTQPWATSPRPDTAICNHQWKPDDSHSHWHDSWGPVTRTSEMTPLRHPLHAGRCVAEGQRVGLPVTREVSTPGAVKIGLGLEVEVRGCSSRASS
jgi:hypothetical protein